MKKSPGIIQRYKSTSRLTKAFIWLSVVLLLIFVAMYSLELQHALNMDPNSYNCTSDSMMMQICQDPYGSSISWTMIKIGILGWPLVAAWLVIGIVLLVGQDAKVDKK